MKIYNCIISDYGISCLEKSYINNFSKYVFGFIYLKLVETLFKSISLEKNIINKEINDITFFE
tara:strand:- start:1164 stop:1352 length:189 start_codon:yes stop_codon:yes gene_type:complete